jgi:hypothetical protein
MNIFFNLTRINLSLYNSDDGEVKDFKVDDLRVDKRWASFCLDFLSLCSLANGGGSKFFFLALSMDVMPIFIPINNILCVCMLLTCRLCFIITMFMIEGDQVKP